MDSILKIWMFYHWLEDQKEKVEITKNHAYLVGSFVNPDAVKELLREDNKYQSSDEDFEKSWQMVQNNSFDLHPNIESNDNTVKIKRKRRTLKE